MTQNSAQYGGGLSIETSVIPTLQSSNLYILFFTYKTKNK